ncbi:MAG: NAD(P)(+) transhydrogenase (Re/Si-specific) subunit beta [Saprospiraceae bacterium]|nr:NAD(P)(+) transhydrogenase (Re/Si-specific) subunit beta [Saprospiraceae bacterium]
MEFQFFIDVALLLAAIMFIIGLRRLSSPDTARTGNLLAAFGMGVAIIAMLIYPLHSATNNYLWIAGGMVVGSVIGQQAAMKVKLTAMPQLVSLFNGFGGACAVLLGFIELYKATHGQSQPGVGELLIVVFTLLVGSVSFTGSMLAFAKLDGRVKDRKVTFRNHQYLNMAFIAITLGMSVYIAVAYPAVSFGLVIAFIIVSLIYGFSFVAPIGGADMPVVISLLNSFTGLTAAAAGLIYDNQIMLLGGVFVGAAGTILTVLMCQAMNRSLLNVVIGGFGSSASSIAPGATGDKVARSITPADAAILLYYSKSVVFVPGYGLAVAQAQKDCKELDELLEANGVSVKYAIHPVAGRMPGHMNVLLAEADVPYPKLLDLDEANPIMDQTDVVVVVGANDVVNPSAIDEPGSPIYGMPVLEVWKAKNVIVMKRSLSVGYAGIDNPLFYHERNHMLFGDAKQSMQELAREVKEL